MPPSPLQKTLQSLTALSDPKTAEFKAKKFGINPESSLGILQKDINALAKEIGWNTALGLELMETGMYEAMLLGLKIFKPRDLTMEMAEDWAAKVNTWELCDTMAMKVFARSPLANDIIYAFCDRDEEFVKRLSFATIAGLCSADKKSENPVFTPYFDRIDRAATDHRLYVRKAVNWALRSLGKRNRDLRKLAIARAERLAELSDKTAKWIGKDALVELTQKDVRISDYPRYIYWP